MHPYEIKVLLFTSLADSKLLNGNVCGYSNIKMIIVDYYKMDFC